LQPSAAEQYSEAAHWVSSGTNMHCPEKQVFMVQPTPSSQSASLQHCAQSPPQHLSLPVHLGAASHVPSALQRSVVHTFLSSQSSGPPQATVVSAPVPALLVVPAEPFPPLELVPPWSAVPAVASPPFAAEKSPPVQPLVQSAGKSTETSAKSTNLGLKKLTAILLEAGKAAR
jgi:hypothetical protein